MLSVLSLWHLHHFRFYVIPLRMKSLPLYYLDGYIHCVVWKRHPYEWLPRCVCPMSACPPHVWLSYRFVRFFYKRRFLKNGQQSLHPCELHLNLTYGLLKKNCGNCLLPKNDGTYTYYVANIPHPSVLHRDNIRDDSDGDVPTSHHTSRPNLRSSQNPSPDRTSCSSPSPNRDSHPSHRSYTANPTISGW